MPSIRDLEEKRLKMDKNMARIRKARSLPASTVRRYRSAFRELVAETFALANTLKDFYLFGGFNIEPDHLPTLLPFLERYSRTDACAKIKRRVVKAILAGDRRAFYKELIDLRSVTRDFFEPLRVYEFPAYRQKAEENAWT